MSSSPQLSIDAFPAWARLNDVHFANTKLQETEGKGLGLVAVKELESLEESGDGDSNDGKGPKTKTTTLPTALLRIPHDLVLSTEAVEEYAKVDQNFRQLLDIAGHQVNTGYLCYFVQLLFGP